MASDLIDAVLRSAPPEVLESAEIPPTFRAAAVHKADAGIFHRDAEKDVRRTIRVMDVPMPQIEPDEVLVAVMASSINYNTVWTALFEPISTFTFLKQLGRTGLPGKRHDQPFHVLGSDAAGVVVRTGSHVRRWKVGDEVVVHTAYVDSEDPISHHDGMLTSDLRAWGYETNYGGLADFTIVKSTQLISKAAHLTWEEAACIPLCGATAYRMLVSDRGVRMKQGDVVLVWGATGGLGAFAVQLVRSGGGIPVGVVSSPQKAEYARKLGCAGVIDRSLIGAGGSGDSFRSAKELVTLRRSIRQQVGEDPHIVFEHVGRATFPASVYLVRKGGKVVTCGSSSGYFHEFDNRYLWMNLKSIVGSHGANIHEAWETNRLVQLGHLFPVLSKVFPLAQVAEATRTVQVNEHVGKVGVLCLAPKEGLGVRDPSRRALLGESQFHRLRAAMPT